MPTPLFGRRTAVECAFLVVVPFAAWKAGASIVWIIAPAALAYLLVLAVEVVLWRRAERPIPAAAAAVEPEFEHAAPPAVEHVRVFRAEPEAAPARAEPEPVAAAEPEPEPEPVAAQPEPVPVPVPVPEPPRLVPVPEPEPQPEPVLAPAPAPAVAQVVPIGATQAPRQWNIWDLEQLAREHAPADDPIAAEERSFLLLYLRDFAGADGLLPVDFDDLVRQSFGALVANR